MALSVDVASVVTDPALLGLFGTFAAGLTQMVKNQFKLDNHLQIQGLSIMAFAVGMLLHFLLPDVWQLVFDLVAGGTGVTGSIGLAKEIRDGKHATPQEK